MHYVLAFVAALAILVVIHELGHYLIARLFAVKVLRFSFGFGKTLWSTRLGSDQTEWAVCVVPMGGYVKMLDESEGPVAAEELHRAFNRQSLLRRSLIVVAGPAANLLLAATIYAAFFVHGTYEFRPIIAAPPAGTEAARVGVEEGSRIVRLNQHAILTWQDLRWALLGDALNHDDITLAVVTADGSSEKTFTLRVPPEIVENPDRDGLRLLGLQLPPVAIRPVIAEVAPGTPAANVGLRAGDILQALDGVHFSDWREFSTMIRGSGGRPVQLEYARDGQVIVIEVLPTVIEQGGQKIGRIGVSPVLPSIESDPRATLVSYGIFESILKGTRVTYETSALTLRMMGEMFFGRISWRNVSGPVMIADYAGQSAKLGLEPYLRFLALISISLGVLNLLPIPVLDGGHLLYYLAEGLTGKPIHERVLEIAQRFGLTVLGTLMVFAFYNDISRLISN